jgi:hypothetical protein
VLELTYSGQGSEGVWKDFAGSQGPQGTVELRKKKKGEEEKKKKAKLEEDEEKERNEFNKRRMKLKGGREKEILQR